MTDYWHTISELLSRPGADRGVHQTFPDATVRLSLIDAVRSELTAASDSEHQRGQQLGDRLQALVQQSRSIADIGKSPWLESLAC